MTEWTEQEIRRVYSEILRRMQLSEEFRNLALRDANAAFEAVSGKRFPVELRLRFCMSEGEPQAVLNEGLRAGELSDGELQQVAGGVQSELYEQFARVFLGDNLDTAEHWRL